MNCCQCQGIENIFSESYVAKELKNYRKRGPDRTTRMLIEAIKSQGIRGLTLLDIGGGVGAIQHGMLEAGAAHATDIDASSAYLAGAKSEAQRRGLVDKISYEHGNFVDIAPQLDAADIVTLDRVICCFPDMEKMVGLSAAKAQKFYGLVYPRDVWWTKLVLSIQNFFLRLTRSRFQTYVHPTQAVEAIVTGNGLRRFFHRQTFVWQVVVFTR
jgi:2-polyprenyl-3-methyl-5-hydroxy-6-metoxy-1,4-benzoquinol methylase